MADNLTLNPLHYDKIGVVHCGVTHRGTVTCGGDLAVLEDGGTHLFERFGIRVTRSGNEYTFTKSGD